MPALHRDERRPSEERMEGVWVAACAGKGFGDAWAHAKSQAKGVRVNCPRCGRFDPRARPCQCVIDRHSRDERHWQELVEMVRREGKRIRRAK